MAKDKKKQEEIIQKTKRDAEDAAKARKDSKDALTLPKFTKADRIRFGEECIVSEPTTTEPSTAEPLPVQATTAEPISFDSPQFLELTPQSQQATAGAAVPKPKTSGPSRPQYPGGYPRTSTEATGSWLPLTTDDSAAPSHRRLPDPVVAEAATHPAIHVLPFGGSTNYGHVLKDALRLVDRVQARGAGVVARSDQELGASTAESLAEATSHAPPTGSAPSGKKENEEMVTEENIAELKRRLAEMLENMTEEDR